jgi:ubiquinone/menaquinone biosynthesis C-methylase UbiE
LPLIRYNADMKDNWSDNAFAEHWGAAESRTNPIRVEQLGILVSTIAANHEPGHLILDIGCGSGQVAERLFEACPGAEIVGVDSSEPMLAMAKNRLSAHAGHFHVVQKDIGALELRDLPVGRYRVAFSSQVLHELNTNLRRILFKKVHRLLEHGGIFLVMDRVRVDLEALAAAYRPVYKRLESASAGKTGYDAYKERVANKEDDPATIAEFVEQLREAHFKTAILHVHFDRAILAAVKT